MDIFHSVADERDHSVNQHFSLQESSPPEDPMSCGSAVHTCNGRCRLRIRILVVLALLRELVIGYHNAASCVSRRCHGVQPYQQRPEVAFFRRSSALRRKCRQEVLLTIITQSLRVTPYTSWQKNLKTSLKDRIIIPNGITNL